MVRRDRPLSVLITDRCLAVRSLLARALAHFGHHAELCEDGRRLLERAQALPFDLLLLDSEAGPAGGLGLLMSLRARGIAVPAILTARGLPSRFASGWCTVSQVRLLLKPFSLGDLERAVSGPGIPHRVGRG